MKFYDMILEDIYKEYDNFPSDIIDEIDKHKFKLKSITNNYFLDEIWKITIDICKKYIETEWIKNLGIEKSLLTEDIKFHSILTIYLSIINKDLKGWSLDECADDYYTNICCSDKYSSKDPDNIINNLKDNFIIWTMCNDDCSNNHSDFYRCFYEDTLERNKEKNIKNILIYIYPEIFYTVLAMWNTCPYNPKKLHKINLNQLSKFHKELQIIITKTDNEFDKIIKSYIIERLFNISYIHTLYEYMIKLYKQKVDKLNNSIADYTKNYTKEHKYKIINFYKKHYNYDDKTIEKALKKILKHEEEKIKEKDQINLSYELEILSDISSIPMIFSRSNYLDIIYKKYKEINDTHCDISIIKFNCSFIYLRHYLIPLLTKVYYYLIICFLEEHTCNNDKDTDTYISTCLKKYIEINHKKYDYTQLVINDKYDKYSTHTINEALEVNIIEIVYDYPYYNITKCRRYEDCEDCEEYMKCENIKQCKNNEDTYIFSELEDLYKKKF